MTGASMLAGPGADASPGRLWHVTLTVAGDAFPGEEVRAALQRLAVERPFLHAGRYAPHRAELRYWEEATSLIDAASLALRLWSEHRTTAALPAWQVVGLEVVDRDTYHLRADAEGRWPLVAPAGQIVPF
jgi:hypothetical protein